MRQVSRSVVIVVAAVVILATAWIGVAEQRHHRHSRADGIFTSAEDTSQQLLDQGRQTFRFDTFGDEAFWGDQLHLHEAIATLTPRKVLDLGLKIDAAVLPPSQLQALMHGHVNLDDTS